MRFPRFKSGLLPFATLPAARQLGSPSRAPEVLVWVFGLLLAAFFGLASAFLPWQLFLSMLGLPMMIAAGLAFPTVLFCIALLLLFGLVPEFIMASLPLGGASIRPAELALLFCFLAVLVRVVTAKIPLLSHLKPLRWPLLVLFGGLFVGFVYGKLFARNTLAMADARQFLGWLALPIGVWLGIAHPGRLQRIIVSIALLAAFLMVLQLALGVQLIFGFRGAENLSKDFNDITRSAIGGGLFFLGYAAYRLFLHACDGERGRWWALLGSLLCIGGVVASFNRAVWAGFVVGALLLLIFKPRTRHSVMVPLLLLFTCVCIGIACLFVAKPRVADAIVERALSIRDEGRKGSSLGFRFDENQQAIAALRRSPVVGVGFGGEYKRTFRQGGEGGGFNIESTYIHNGYLSLWLKLGLLGVLVPPLLFIVTWALRRSCRPEHALSSVAGFASLLLLFVSMLTSPDLTASSGSVAVASLLALMLLGRPPDEPVRKRVLSPSQIDLA